MADWLAGELKSLIWLVISGALVALSIVVVYGPIMLLCRFAEWLDYRRAYRRALNEEQEAGHPERMTATTHKRQHRQ